MTVEQLLADAEHSLHYQHDDYDELHIGSIDNAIERLIEAIRQQQVVINAIARVLDV